MRVIAVSALREFWITHPAAEQPLRAWYDEVVAADWAGPADLKVNFGSASILQSGRAVFNIAGNKYRLVVAIAYRLQVVFIKFIGTHAQYDKINAQTIEWRK